MCSSDLLGEYRGVCWLEDAPQGTVVELATWLKPSRPIPTGLLLFVERKTFLDGVRNFLEECERYPQSSQEVTPLGLRGVDNAGEVAILAASV